MSAHRVIFLLKNGKSKEVQPLIKLLTADNGSSVVVWNRSDYLHEFREFKIRN